MTVKVTHRWRAWNEKEQRDMKVSLLELATVIHRDAQNLAPVETGNLRASGRVKVEGLKATVSFGGNGVRYAKRRHYENRKNPHTLRYLEKSGDRNSKNFVRYLKGK